MARDKEVAMRRTRGLEWGCAVLLVLALAGCREGPPQSSSDQPTAFSSTSETSVRPTRPAKDVYADWLTNAVRRGTGHFTLDLPISGSAVHDEGDYRVAPQGSSFTRRSTGPNGSLLALEVFANERSTWLRATAGPVSYGNCWAADPDSLVAAYGIDLGDAAGPQHPALAVFGHTEVIGYARDRREIEATTSLYTLMSLLGRKATRSLGIPKASKARAPIRIQLDGEQVIGWSASLSAVLGGARKDGFRSGLLDPSDFTDARVTVTISRIGAPFTEEPPRPGRVVDLVSDPKAFAAALKACING